MKTLFLLWTFLLVVSCGETEQEHGSTNERLELIPEPDRAMREEYEYKRHLEEKLQVIREQVRKTSATSYWTRIEKKELWESAEGGEAQYYFINDKVEKIVVQYFGETAQQATEYYLYKNKLTLAVEKSYEYNRPISWDSTAMKENSDDQVFDADKSVAMEDSSYFEKGVLLWQVSNRDCGSPFAQDYLQKEQERLQGECEDLLRLLQGQ